MTGSHSSHLVGKTGIESRFARYQSKRHQRRRAVAPFTHSFIQATHVNGSTCPPAGHGEMMGYETQPLPLGDFLLSGAPCHLIPAGKKEIRLGSYQKLMTVCVCETMRRVPAEAGGL